MQRIGKCLRFVLNRSVRVTAFFLAFYVFLFLCFLVVFTARPSGGQTYYNYYFFGVAVFFVFPGLAFPYMTVSNSLLLFGNTRRIVFSAAALNAAIICLGLAVLSVLDDFFNPWLAGVLRFRTVPYMQLLFPHTPEQGGGALLWLLFYFATLLAIAGAALLYGALLCRFGRRFNLVFWLGFGVLFGALPGLIGTLFRTQFEWVFNGFFAVGRADSLLQTSLHFVLVAAVLGGAAFLVARRQELRGSDA